VKPAGCRPAPGKGKGGKDGEKGKAGKDGKDGKGLVRPAGIFNITIDGWYKPSPNGRLITAHIG